MKLTHHVPVSAIRAKAATPEPISERYEQELQAAERKARRAWKAAERRLSAAEKRAEEQATTATATERDRLREEVIARLAELHEIEELMKSKVGGAKWSGRGSVRAVKKGNTL